MAIKIQKVKVNGKYIYAATILEAVKQATAGTNYGKTLAEIIGHPAQTVGEEQQAATGLYKAIVDGDAASVQAFKDLVGELKIGETTYNTVKGYADAVAAKAQANAESTAKAITGELTSLSTTEKGTLVGAINELKSAIGDNEIHLDKAETAETGFLTTYVLSKGASKSEIGKINIPKDFLVKSGSVKTVATADAPYTGAVVGDKYLDFVLNVKEGSATDEHMYLPVNELFDSYTSGSAEGAQVVVTVDNSTNKISASITAGTITETELSESVNASLDKADSAIQSVAEGTANGTISVDGSNVSVHGLGSAAFTESTAYDAAGTAQGIVDALGGSKEGSSNGVKVTVSTSKGEVSAVTVEAPDFANTYDAKGAAATAKSEVIGASTDTKDANTVYGAKAYADAAIASALVVENVADTTDYAEVW